MQLPMANILLNYQTNNLRYAVEELTDCDLYSWRALAHEYAKTMLYRYILILKKI